MYFLFFLAVAPAQQKVPWRGGSFCSLGSRVCRNLATLPLDTATPPREGTACCGVET